MGSKRDDTIAKALAALKARLPEERGVIKALEAIRAAQGDLPKALKPTLDSNLPGAVLSVVEDADGEAHEPPFQPPLHQRLNSMESTLRVLEGNLDQATKPRSDNTPPLKLADPPTEVGTEGHLRDALGDLNESLELISSVLASKKGESDNRP